MNPLELSSICKPAAQAVVGKMQLTLHGTRRTPNGAFRLVQEMSAWLLGESPTRSVPVLQACEGSMATAMHEYGVHIYPSKPHTLLTSYTC